MHLPRRARRARGRAAALACTTSSAITHGEGRDLLAPDAPAELVPDLAERDVFLCGPPAMTDALEQNAARGRRAASPCPRRALRPVPEKETDVRRTLTDHAGRSRPRRARERSAAAATRAKATPKKVIVANEDVHRPGIGQADRWGNVQVTHHRQEDDDHRRRRRRRSKRQITVGQGPGLPEPHRPLGLHQPQALPCLVQEALQAQSTAHRRHLGRDLHERRVRPVAAGRDPQGEGVVTPTLPGMPARRAVMGMPIVIDLRDEDATTRTARRRCSTGSAWSTRRFSTYRDDSEIMPHQPRRARACATRTPTCARSSRAASELRARHAGSSTCVPPPATIDPSGLVKGWSVDRVAAILDEAGCANYAINAGGDVRAPRRGPAGRLLARRNPAPARSATRSPRSSSRPTSRSRRPGAYARGDHVLDPHTRRPPPGVLSVTITGPDLATADAYATAAFAMGMHGPGAGPRGSAATRR